MTSDAARTHEQAERRLQRISQWAVWLRVGTAILVVVLIAMVAWLGHKLDESDKALDRQDCIAHVNGAFFSHLADALSKQPASTNRQTFLNRMKDDSAKLTHLDASCPK
jgi:hypothetical protein